MLYRWWVVRVAAFVTLLSLLLIVGARVSRNALAQEPSDLLIYALGDNTVWLYDPFSRMSLPTPLTDFADFSIDGKLAYKVQLEVADDIYRNDVFIWDVQMAATAPINITQNPDADDSPLTWSRDGHYLALTSWRASNDGGIYIWDGETIRDITPSDLENIISFEQAMWSFDGKLAFAVSTEDDSGEIFVWDGDRTSNVSQNTENTETLSAWSIDGRLAFSSGQNRSYTIYVWDGISFVDGAPDTDSFINVTAEVFPSGLASNFRPVWTNDGYLIIRVRDTEIYRWDGQHTTRSDQLPIANSLGQNWTNDGQQAFYDARHIYIRDALDNMLAVLVGWRTAAWNRNDDLTFCRVGDILDGQWILAIWNGQEIVDIAESGYIKAQSQGGAVFYCFEI